MSRKKISLIAVGTIIVAAAAVAGAVTVIGPDEYRLDQDHDGGGCESS